MFRTNIYIDGFNLYFGSLKRSKYKWLDVSKMCSLLLSERNAVRNIKYFTAQVSARLNDPQQPVRQQMYYRALRTVPNLKIICGQFQTRKTRMPLVNCEYDRGQRKNNHILFFRSNNEAGGRPESVKQHLYYSQTDLHDFDVHAVFSQVPKDQIQSAYVLRTDEKGSDVNLATHLVYDACKNDFDVAIVVSNDSDLYEAIRLSIGLGKTVGVFNPQQKPVSRKLASVATFVRPIREGVLSASQFPEVMQDAVGDFRKPSEW